jgi:penicillin-binding protein, 1A family
MRDDRSRETQNRDGERTPIRLFSIFKGFFLFLLFLLIGAAAFASVLVVIMLQDITKDLPQIIELKTPSLTSTVYDRNGGVIAKLFEENRTWVGINEISPWAKKAVLAAEDSEFYEHRGIRIKAIIRAMVRDLERGGAKQGGSTITQQLARMLFLSRERTLQRKASEAIIAVRMERRYTKDEILEMYLNMAYFGHGAYGIAAASQNYFGKPPSELTLAEASILAGLLPAPNSYTPLRNPERAKTRQNYVLSRMVDTGMITQEERGAAYAKELTYARSADSKIAFVMEDAPYFVSHILFKELLPTYGRDRVYRGGLNIHTTIDMKLQRHAESVVSKMKFEGALVTLDPHTGEILAMVGGRDFEKSKFNRATQAYRQPGSSFKPIVYAAAFEGGYRPVDRVLDAPLKFRNGWSPKNSDGKFRGEITITEALPLSINTAAVRMAQVIGVGPIRNQAKKMGITTPYLPEDLSIALGSSSLTPMEMCVAFSSFANNGHRVEPFGIKQIIDNNGNVIEQNGPQISNAMSPETSVTMRSLLMQAVSWGTGTRAQIKDYQVFGKTGTTNDFTDVWFVGGTPDLVSVVYIGNDNHKSLGRAFGGTVAAPVWKEYMEKAVGIMGTPKKFTVPPGTGVQSVTVCRMTGFVATKSCPKKANIMMPVGQVPDSSCPWHGGDVSAARNDPNSPVLVLTPEDEDLRGQYQLQQLNEAEALPQNVQETQDAGYVPPPPTIMDPYQNDPTPATEVEKRYQELLERYNIK